MFACKYVKCTVCMPGVPGSQKRDSETSGARTAGSGDALCGCFEQSPGPLQSRAEPSLQSHDPAVFLRGTEISMREHMCSCVLTVVLFRSGPPS